MGSQLRRTPEESHILKVAPDGRFCQYRPHESREPLVPVEYGTAYKKAAAEEPPHGWYGGKIPASLYAWHLRSPFDLTIPTKSTKERKPRGSGGFTKGNKGTVKSGTYLLEREYGRDRISFLTATLPPAVADRLNACVRGMAKIYWSKALREFKRRLLYLLRSASLPEHIIGVSEVQGKRYRRDGTVALHLHWAFVGRLRYGHWAIAPQQLKDAWMGVWQSVLETPMDKGDWVVSIDVKRVRKSLRGYLAKYMSKGGSIIETIIKDGLSELLPSSWCVCTDGLCKWIQKETRLFVGTWVLSLMESLRSAGSIYIAYGKHVYVERDPYPPYWVAFAGELTTKGMECLLHLPSGPSTVSTTHPITSRNP